MMPVALWSAQTKTFANNAVRFFPFFYRIFLFWQLKIYDDFFSFVKLNVSSESRLLFQFAFGSVCVFEVIEMK